MCYVYLGNATHSRRLLPVPGHYEALIRVDTNYTVTRVRFVICYDCVDNMKPRKVARWLGVWWLGRRTGDQQVASSTFGHALPGQYFVADHPGM